MKNYTWPALMGLAALTLIACNPDEPVQNEPETGEIVEEAAENTGENVRQAGEEVSAAVSAAASETGDMIENELSQSNARGFTARNVIGETIRDQDGHATAIVDDLLFDDAHTLRALVLRDGAVLGLGGDEAVIGADKVSFAISADGDLSLSAAMTNGELQQMTKSLAYEPTSGAVFNPGDLISIKRLLGRSVVNANNDKIAELFDVILVAPGQWRSFVLSVGGVGPIGNRLIEIDRSLMLVDRGAGRLIIDGSLPDFDTMATFEY